MINGPLFSTIVLYTVPIILTSVLQLLFNAADLVIVGRFCGSITVAAVGATGSLTSLLVNLFIGLSVGAGIPVAHALGSREHEVVHRTVHTALPLSLVSGVFLTIVGVLFSEGMLRMMDTPENVLPLSALYMKTYFLGITFTMIYNFCASILRAAGDTKGPLIYLSIAGIINVVLNIFFVTALDMSVAGVGLATSISQGVSAILVVNSLMRRTDSCRLQLSKMRFYGPQLSRILRIGLPAGIQRILFSISNVIIQSSFNTFGDIFISGNSAAVNIEGFLYVSVNSFQQTVTNFIGQNMGARKLDRVKRSYRICLALVSVVGLALSLLIFAFGEQLLSIYIVDSQEAITYGMRRILHVSLPYVLLGLCDVVTGALRGMGASLAPMILSILGICGIRVGWVYFVFPFFPTPECLFLSYPISWAITFLVQLVFFRYEYRRQERLHQPS